MADKLIILGNGTIAYQGTLEDLARKPESMLKVNIAEVTKNNADQQVDKTVASRNLKVAEAISDLNRATGDFSLYGRCLSAVCRYEKRD